VSILGIIAPQSFPSRNTKNEDLTPMPVSDKFLCLTYPYVLGLLNSKLLDWYLKHVSSPFRGGYYSYNRQYIEQLPIRTIDFSDPTDKVHHDRMVELVETMLDLHKQLAAAKTSHEETAIQRQINAIDKQIDQLVYELYGLTDKEIRIVEEATQLTKKSGKKVLTFSRWFALATEDTFCCD